MRVVNSLQAGRLLVIYCLECDNGSKKNPFTWLAPCILHTRDTFSASFVFFVLWVSNARIGRQLLFDLNLTVGSRFGWSQQRSTHTSCSGVRAKLNPDTGKCKVTNAQRCWKYVVKKRVNAVITLEVLLLTSPHCAYDFLFCFESTLFKSSTDLYQKTVLFLIGRHVCIFIRSLKYGNYGRSGFVE